MDMYGVSIKTYIWVEKNPSVDMIINLLIIKRSEKTKRFKHKKLNPIHAKDAITAAMLLFCVRLNKSLSIIINIRKFIIPII
jgi:hypothetical protein